MRNASIDSFEGAKISNLKQLAMNEDRGSFGMAEKSNAMMAPQLNMKMSAELDDLVAPQRSAMMAP